MKSFALLLVLLLSVGRTNASFSEAGVIFLMLSPSVRADGFGEAFVALADDATATYWNPAGQGHPPLAHSWRSYLLNYPADITGLAVKQRSVISGKYFVWAGTKTGVLQFDGVNWLDHELYILETNDNLDKVTKKFLADTEDAEALETAMEKIKIANGISVDKPFEDLVELKVPFSIGVGDEVTALDIDRNGEVWIGTAYGLKRYNGRNWKNYTTLDGLSSNRIQAIRIQNDEIWIGTDKGLSIYYRGEWRSISQKDGLSDNSVTAIGFDKNSQVWVGTQQGLNRGKKSGVTNYQWHIFLAQDGLIENQITDIAFDQKQNVVWVANPHGINKYDGSKWLRIVLKNNEVYTLASDGAGELWVGTRMGAMKYNGVKWFSFHDQNGLSGNVVRAVQKQGRDTWIVNNKGIDRYDYADREIYFKFQNLLPSFGLEDLYFSFITVTWPTEEWGTIGGHITFVNYGEQDWIDETGRKLGTFQSYDMDGTLSYGLKVSENTAVGTNFKFIYSRLASADIKVGNEKGKGIGWTFSIDLAVLKKDIFNRLNLGLNIQHMGPDIFYIDPDQADPLPFNIKAGLSFKLIETTYNRLRLTVDANRLFVRRGEPFYFALIQEFAKNNLQQFFREIVYNGGIEYWYADFFALRGGYLLDEAGKRSVYMFGAGLKYNKLNMDFAYIWAPGNDQVLKGTTRYGISINF